MYKYVDNITKLIKKYHTKLYHFLYKYIKKLVSK